MDHLFDDAWRQMQTELAGVKSDRAVAIVSAALLDSRLEELLRAFLVENADSDDELLDSESGNAPLGTFGARITMAYAIGLIQRPDRNALRIIKKVRNLFAHQLGLTFASPEIASRCYAIGQECPTKNVGRGDRGPGELFHASVCLLAGKLAENRYLVTEFQMQGTFKNVFRLSRRE